LIPLYAPIIPTLVREPFHRDGWIYSYGRSPAPLSRDSRWQPRGDAAPFAISQLYRDEDTTIATAVTAAGTLSVRVYDTKQGTVLVPDQALPVRGGVFAAGKIFTGDKATIPFEGHTVHPCQVTAYSIATGAQLWLTIQPFPASGPTTSSCSAAALIADRKRVIIGGAGHFGDEFMAQGYDAETGAFLWEHLSLIGTLGFDAVIAADMEKRLVFVAGWTHTSSATASARTSSSRPSMPTRASCDGRRELRAPPAPGARALSGSCEAGHR
jgi:hypothetical protein